ncbi:cytochrome c2 [Cereibacter johrii]|uniref:Cytochrome c n=1 Tax=Cereibacter johrii TaxID=445629 RepID=A0ABX5JDZ7_9RHOB|nr:cytochrome c2 [Cereibacter johrii]QCP85021.1 c-type cytochrome [Cereibacter sphaeroides]RDS94578.1 cytochrome C [Cereibacter sphaeroides f. sp. denitrificans]MEA5161079.1 cytochrome c2 [Cereibacter johrii]ODM44783.1 cytochrome C [Cereibacter johrii]PTM80544.1 cytochrome c [Cereibacter johrii]
MKFQVKALAAIAAFAALPALAQEGDPEAGAKAFNQCQTCHVIVDDAGTTIAGRNAKTGPNLYGVVGRTAGTQADFKGYGDGMKEAGAKGLAWDEEHFVQYVQDPTKFLKDYTGDAKAKGKMTFKLKKEEDAHNIWAYLQQVAVRP